jgi:hypothetical protein
MAAWLSALCTGHNDIAKDVMKSSLQSMSNGQETTQILIQFRIYGPISRIVIKTFFNTTQHLTIKLLQVWHHIKDTHLVQKENKLRAMIHPSFYKGLQIINRVSGNLFCK